MPIEINMPRLSDTMEEGTLIKWRVKVGDKVKSGDLLADVETDKATMELQSYDDGSVAKLAVEEGQVTPVGKLILLLAEEGENIKKVADSVPRIESSPNQVPSTVPVQTAGVTRQASMVNGSTIATLRIRISPVARKIAEEHGVDLKTISGSGPDGRITKRDVLEVIDSTATLGSDDKVTSPVVVSPTTMPMQSNTVALSPMRKTIARRLVESKSTIPHYTVTVTVRMDSLIELRSALNAQLNSQGLKLSVNDFIVRASAMALAIHPWVNSSWTDDGIRQHSFVNVGVAIAVGQEKGGGLVVATIRQANQKTLRQINAETRQLAQKARTGGLSLEDMADGTFTISNLGMYGVDHFEAIINPPQAAILAVGAAIERPTVRNNQIVVGHEMTATLSADHRVIDGAMAAQFLQDLKQTLENPVAMIV